MFEEPHTINGKLQGTFYETSSGFKLYLAQRQKKHIHKQRNAWLFDTMFLDGYGEEVDFSYRVRKAGFTVVCADDTFVYHKGRSSFTDPVRRKYLHHRAERILKGFWSNYPDDLLQFQERDPFAPLARRIEGALQKAVRP